MLFTSAAVLLVGLVRWYAGPVRSRRRERPEADEPSGRRGEAARAGRAGLTAALQRATPPTRRPPTRPPRRARAASHAVGRSATGALDGRPKRRDRPSVRRHRRAPGQPRRRWTTPPSRPASAPATTPDARIRRPRAAPPRQGAARSGPARPPTAGSPPRPARPQRPPDPLAAAASTRTSRSSPYDTPASPAPRRRPAPNGRSPRRITRSHRSGIARPPAATSRSTSRPRRGRASRRPLLGLDSSGARAGSRAAARTPASRWPSSPAEPRRSRARPAAPARRAPAPRAPTRRR